MSTIRKPERAAYNQSVEAQQEYLFVCCTPYVCEACLFDGSNACCHY